MLSKKAFGAALLGLAGLALVQTQLPGPAASGENPRPPATDAGGAAAPQPPADAKPGVALIARALPTKIANTKLAVPPGASGRLMVKFKDDVKARATGKQVQSVSAANLDAFQQIVDAHGLTVRCALSPSLNSLKQIVAKAAAYSGRAQPDLAGIMYVESPAPDGVPLAAAQAINNLPSVEFVDYEPLYVVNGGGACCLPNGSCVDVADALACVAVQGSFRPGTVCPVEGLCGGCCVPPSGGGDPMCQDDHVAASCAAAGGVFQNPGSNCTAIDCNTQPDCGEVGTGDCFAPHATPFCTFDDCCNTVCTIDPFCCDATGSVFWPGRGSGQWDDWCADHALELAAAGSPDCGGGPGLPCPPAGPVYNTANPTPNFTDAQGYLTASGYTDPPPANIAPALRYIASGPPDVMPGFTGEGYDLQGAWDIGQILINAGLATENLARGKSIKVGVIEHTAFLDSALGPGVPYAHEDLAGKVVTETGNNRFLIIPNSSPLLGRDGNHGTATLGIIGAINNRADGTLRPQSESPTNSLTDQRGMVGIAPDANLYFFSITTLSGGGVLDAISRALDPNGGDFGFGDVLSFSIGPSDCGTLASNFFSWLFLNQATSSGVSCVLSAGNGCCNLDSAPQFGDTDSGVIIVGASLPGASGGINWCRIQFSNYCQDCQPASDVHAAAWGTAVASPGYGALFVGNSNNSDNRSYTNNFGGTSAAAPQVAGLVACLQGLAKMKWSIPLTPVQIRAVLGSEVNPVACGLPFGGNGIPPGTSDTGINCLFGLPVPCLPQPLLFANGDWDIEATGDSIGAYSNAFQCANVVVTNPWFDGNPFLDSIEILEGELIFGNGFSVAASDDNYLIVQSVTTSPSGPGGSQRGNVASGKETDVLVHFHTVGTNVQDFGIQVEAHVTGPPVFMLVYLYNWDQLQWMIAGLAIVDGADFTPEGFPDLFAIVGNPDPFINENDNHHVMVRVWTVALGVSPQYQCFLDRVSIDFSGFQFVPGG